MNKRSATIRVWNLLDHTRINEKSFITDMLKKRSFYLAAIVTFLLLLFSFGQSAAAADLPEANLASSTPKVMETPDTTPRDNNFIPSTIRFFKSLTPLNVLIIIVGIAFFSLQVVAAVLVGNFNLTFLSMRKTASLIDKSTNSLLL